jgi:hypothetical protein
MKMRPSRHAFGFLVHSFAALLFFAAMTPSLLAQQNAGSSSPKPAAAPAPHPSGGSSGGGTPHPNNTGAGAGAHPNTNTGTGAHTNTGTATNTKTNSTYGHTTGTNAAGAKTGTGTVAGKTGYGTSAKTGTSTGMKTNATMAGGNKGVNTPGTTKMANGGTHTVHTNGSVVERGSNGKLSSVTTAKGTTAKMNSNGKVATIQNNKGMTINHAPNGSRTIVSNRPNNTRVVSTGKGRGYTEHHFSRGGHEYARRTYYSHGHYYARVYRPYYYHGYPYYGYVPGYYYAPGYYGWAYNPWASPVYYNWGWGAAPWYNPYGYYFAPYPYYGAPYFWLTDYMVAATLAAAYESANASNLNSQPGYLAASYRVPDDNKSKDVVLTPEIKKMLADEIKMQIAKDKDAAAAQGGSAVAALGGGSDDQTPPSLDPDFTVFVVSTDLNVTVNGDTCALTPGDFIHREVDAPGSDGAVAVKVVGSKKEDCPVGSDTRIQLEDLNDMYNHFREQLDAGMKELSEKQGKNGIPAGPAANPKTNPEGQAAPDLTVQSDLEKTQAEADEAEKDVNTAAADANKS